MLITLRKVESTADSPRDMDRSLRISSYLALLTMLSACHSAKLRVVSKPAVSSSKLTGHEAHVSELLSRALPSLKGERLKATVLEVTYAAGGFSRPHRHPCPVIGYVVEGALRTRVSETRETIIHAGEMFYEEPNGIHRVSANASDR